MKMKKKFHILEKSNIASYKARNSVCTFFCGFWNLFLGKKLFEKLKMHMFLRLQILNLEHM